MKIQELSRLLGRENDDSWSELQEHLSRIDEVLLCAIEKKLIRLE